MSETPPVVVISQSHDLVPLAWRLVLEGRDVGLIILKDSVEGVWAGNERLTRRLSGADKRDPEKRAQLFAEMVQAGAMLVTDSRKWATDALDAGVLGVFGPHRLIEADRPPPPPVTIGGWFNGHEVVAPHLVVSDVGLWPGGAVGPRITGALTLVRPAVWPTGLEIALSSTNEALRAANYLGLVRAAVKPNAEGRIAPEDIYLGWGWLHSHAFVAELGDGGPGLGDVLGGAEPRFPHTFTTVVPVSMAPWPGRPDRGESWARVEIPPPSLQGDCFFHAIQFEHGKVWTGPVQGDSDGGLVAVARGAGNSMALARGRALAHAAQLGRGLREPQFRVDAGETVEEVLATFESKGVGLF